MTGRLSAIPKWAAATFTRPPEARRPESFEPGTRGGITHAFCGCAHGCGETIRVDEPHDVLVLGTLRQLCPGCRADHMPEVHPRGAPPVAQTIWKEAR